MAEQTNSSNVKPLSTSDKITALEAKLENKLAEHKLSFVSQDSEIDEVFSIGMEELGKMPNQKIAEYAFIIARYGTYLQKELNKEKAARNWAKRCLDFIVLPRMGDYRVGYISNEELRMKAIIDNDVAQKFHAYLVEKEQNIDLMLDLSFDIRKMSDTLTDLSKSKRYNNGG